MECVVHGDIVNVHGVERVEYHQRWPLKFNCEMSENSLTSVNGAIGYDRMQQQQNQR